MLFEEEKKALNFIKFNSGEYEDRVPVRAYYCHVCMGWHITSKSGNSYVNPIVNDVIAKYRGVQNTYNDDIIEISNMVLFECGTIKKGNLSPKNIRRKISKLIRNRNILSKHFTSHDFALIEKNINEAFAVIERRCSLMELGYES